MSKKLNKRRAMRQMAKDTPDVKVVTLPYSVFQETVGEYDIWNKHFLPWTDMLKIKYGRPMKVDVTTTDLNGYITIRAEVQDA